MIYRNAIFLLSFLVAQLAWAYRPDPIKGNPQKLSSREGNCAPATKQVDLEINNIRARLTNGGDVWWDGVNGRYVVPKVEPGAGKREVSSIFAGSVWVGGFTNAGALKLMAQTYRNATSLDCWPGPLNPKNGETTREDCINWDQFFEVKGANITEFRKRYKLAIAEGRNKLEISEIPEDVLYWPARGNKYFSSKYNFELPNLPQGLGNFLNDLSNPSNDPSAYEPELGDYPIVEVYGCEDIPIYPDQMFFWIFNDAGGVHSASLGDPIRMEVQVQAFAYQTGDEINDMTFQRYKLVNRSPEDINRCYFAMWVDADLGCSEDDYIGCDTTFEGYRRDGSVKNRDLMYIYNQDATDGVNGCNCPGGVATYCNDIPILGIDYFRGPLDRKKVKDSNGQDSLIVKEIGMSSFMYYNRRGAGSNPPQTEDPTGSVEHYNYLTGRWRDGTRLTVGGNGYNPGSTNFTNYAFPGRPSDPSGWSMCSVNLGFGDRRTLQATGPLLLGPGDINELIIGVTWVPDQEYPCPDISALLAADKLCQDLFDNCFKLKDGPTAPNVEFIELDQELIMVLSNEVGSNNEDESYEESGIGLPENVDDKYRFEGYRIFQIASPDVTLNSQTINDPSKVREIFTVDLKNNIKKVYNWVGVKNPNPSATRPIIYYPTLMVDGTDSGIRYTFQITEDQFAVGNRDLINHKKYYFIVLAYGYNNFRSFSVDSPSLTQRIQYCPGRLNLGPEGDGKPYTAIPRPQVYEKLNSRYNSGVEITRLDGIGAGNNFLEMKNEMYDVILNGRFDGQIHYKVGAGPVQVKVYNPLKVQDGDYELRFIDNNMSNNRLDSVTWYLVYNGKDTVKARGSFYKFNEQVIAKYGLSITIGQTIDAGNDSLNSCGVVGTGLRYNYKDLNGEIWYVGQPDNNTPFTDFIKNSLGQGLYRVDPKECWSNLGDGPFKGTWYPLIMCSDTFYLTPRYVGTNSALLSGAPLKDLNNVDIVFTNDKSKWSRCIVVETWNPRAGNQLNSEASGQTSFAVKNLRSVGKEDANDDGVLDHVPGDNTTGYSWFPGYAIDVESGRRVNIFFGENSFYRPDEIFTDCNTKPLTGHDMTWNPTDEYIFDPSNRSCVLQFDLRLVLGGQHHIYVTKQQYDSCNQIRARLSQTAAGQRVIAFREMTWTSMSALLPNAKMLKYKDGYIPNELTVQLRVDNPYQWAVGTNENRGHNLYRFKIQGYQMTPVAGKEAFESALDHVNVVPNPYYGFSAYETGQFSNVVKITNLPPKCEIEIYSIDGKFIKRYNRDETPIKVVGTNIGITERQISPDVEWDLTNFRGIPVSSGVYLIYIRETSTGAEKIIKWFGVARKFDPSGL